MIESAPSATAAKSTPPKIPITIDGRPFQAEAGKLLVDVIQQSGRDIPHVCYHPQLGPIQTCDTCLVELDGQLVRACGTTITQPATVLIESKRAKDAQLDAFDRILQNHLLYCTVCDNNNGNCTVHNTTAMLNVEHQTASIPAQTIRSR